MKVDRRSWTNLLAMGCSVSLLTLTHEARAEWVQAATLTRPAGLGGADTSFGRSVACSGNTVLVGAPNEDDYDGAVYSFSGNNYSQVERFTAPVAEGSDGIGGRLSISGDTALVGSTRIDGGNVRFFVRAGGGWTLQQTILSTGPASTGAFGHTVIVRGDLAVVGAPKESGDTGRVYVYRRDGSVWIEEAQLSASDPAMSDFFGLGLAFSGNTILATAPTNPLNDSERGAAYVFTRTGHTWSEQARIDLRGHDPRPPTLYFGGSAALHGDRALITGTMGSSVPVEGRIFVYQRSGSTWQLEQSILAPQAQSFASAVTLQGDRVWGMHADGTGRLLQEFQFAAGAWAPTQSLPPFTDTFASYAVCGQTLVHANGGSVTVYRDATITDADPTAPSASAGGGSTTHASSGCSYAPLGTESSRAAAWLSVACLLLGAATQRRRVPA